MTDSAELEDPHALLREALGHVEGRCMLSPERLQGFRERFVSEWDVFIPILEAMSGSKEHSEHKLELLRGLIENGASPLGAVS